MSTIGAPPTFLQVLGARLNGYPVRDLRRWLVAAESAELTTSWNQLLAHHHAGGRSGRVVEAAQSCREIGLAATFHELAALDLSGHDPVQVAAACEAQHTITFRHYTEAGTDRIRGFCQDGTEVFPSCTLRYRLPLSHVYGGARLGFIQERLSTRASVIAHTSTNLLELRRRQSEYEAVLLSLGRELLPTLLSVELAFQEAP